MDTFLFRRAENKTGVYKGDLMHTGTKIYMSNVPGEPKERELTRPLVCQNIDGSESFVPTGYRWDGSSVPAVFQGVFPRHNHPIASCRHDWRCDHARTPVERHWADREFEKDVGTTSWWITKKIGYLGARAGAFFGIGCHYQEEQ